MKQLILIHGAIGGADQLYPLKEILKNDFEVHVLEFEGHGTLASNNDSFSIEKFDHQLKDKLSEVGKPAHIFGYSMGGFVALLHAANGARNIQSIITLGTKMRWSGEIAEKETQQLNPDIIEAKVPKFAQALEKRHGIYWKNLLIKTADFMRLLGDIKPIKESTMSQIDIPVKLCLADQDHMVSREETEEVKGWIRNCTFEVLPESKHPIEQVNLMALASTIKSFINALKSGYLFLNF